MQKPSINENSCSLKCVVHVHPFSALHELQRGEIGSSALLDNTSPLPNKTNKMKPKQISFYVWLNFACQKRKPFRSVYLINSRLCLKVNFLILKLGYVYKDISNNCQSLNSSAQQLLRFLIPIFAI